jgi:hypothetical protein
LSTNTLLIPKPAKVVNVIVFILCGQNLVHQNNSANIVQTK